MTENQYTVSFREEAHELLVELEVSLLELEGHPDNGELIGRVFRALHTVKGSGAMFGFEDVSAFTHDVETCFDQVRAGKVPVTKSLIDLTLQARDCLLAMLDAPPGAIPFNAPENALVLEGFRDLLAAPLPGGEKPHHPGSELVLEPLAETSPTPPPADLSSFDQAITDQAVTYRIRFHPAPAILANGTNIVSLLNEFNDLGPSRVVAHTEHIPSLDQIEPETCYTWWDIILTSDRDVNALKDIFIFVEDQSEVKIDVIDTGEDEPGEEDRSRVGDILLNRGDITVDDLRRAIKRRKLLGELLVEQGTITPETVESALAEQEHIRVQRERRQAKQSQQLQPAPVVEATTSVRVPSEKLDILVNLVGELVTVQARLTQTAGSLGDSRLSNIAEEVERLTAELRDNTMSIRMLPLGATFSRFRRLVRDAAQELGKKVSMTTEGEDTELDKTVIDRLSDPLIHIIRNSVDHGIEMPEDRAAANKPREGTVHLSAVHSGANVLISVKDDGRGLDPTAIRAKALEKGLIAQEVELSEKDLYNLVFLPGFSTAAKITNLSGRGVGMDVVKRNIDALGGTVEVESRLGEGTIITLKLPLTLAIIEGLLVGVGEERFVLPLSSVEECIELSREDIRRACDRHLVSIRGEIVPYIRLREYFEMGGECPEIEQVVVTGLGGRRVGFVVDTVIGQLQTVIKNLGRIYRNVEGLSGATILGDGSVALIVDVLKLALLAERDAATILKE